MTTEIQSTSMQQYLDKSVEVLKKYGVLSKGKEEDGLVTLLENVVNVDEPKVLAISKTVQYMGEFNELVRDNVKEIKISDRYNDITQSFDSIREDSKVLVEQLDDGKIDFSEKIKNFQMKVFRGTPHKRFEKIRDKFLDVSEDTKNALNSEEEIMEAYMDFRTAIKGAEALAYQVKDKQILNLEKAKNLFDTAQKTVVAYTGTDNSEKSNLELSRDNARRAYDVEEGRMQLITDIADNLKIGYNVGETLVAKLKQTHDVKRQVYNRSITFFQTNEHIFTFLDAVYTSTHGLHEATKTLDAMADGANKGLEDVADLGTMVGKEGIKAGYGKQLEAASVKKLVDSIYTFQLESTELINQYRKESTENAKEIEKIVEEGKKKSHEAVMKYTPVFQ